MQTNDYARLFYQHGFSVVPLDYASKHPAVKWSQFQEQRAEETLVEFWFSQHTNLAVITGYNGLTVLDFDTHTEYLRWLSWITLQPAWPSMRRAFTVRTSRGVHVYMRLATPTRNRRIKNIDIKGRFGFVVGPGSIHPSGAIYTPLGRFYIPTIEALSDVLPAPLLLSKQGISPAILPFTPAPVNKDPWDVANRPFDGVFDDDLVTTIRRKFRIEQFFTAPLTKSGTDMYMTQCPFHDDQTPSFWIASRTQVCGCHACNFPKPLDVINLYAMLYGLNNRMAIFALAAML